MQFAIIRDWTSRRGRTNCGYTAVGIRPGVQHLVRTVIAWLDDGREPFREERLHGHETGDYNSGVSLDCGPEGNRGVVIGHVGRISCFQNVDEAYYRNHANTGKH